MSDDTKPKRRAVAMVGREAGVAVATGVASIAPPKACASCADKDAQIAALSAELSQVRGSLVALQRIRG